MKNYLTLFPWLALVVFAGLFPVSAAGQGSDKRAQEWVQRYKTDAEFMEPLDSAAHYMNGRDFMKNRTQFFTDLISDLPDIERQSIAAGAEKFPDVATTKTRADYRQKFLFNASGLAVPDRAAYFQLVQLNLRGLVSSFVKAQSSLEQILNSYSPELLAQARQVDVDNMVIGERLQLFKSNGDRVQLKSAYDLAITPQQRRLVEKAVIDSVTDKLLIFNTEMKPSGKTSSSGGSELTASLGLGRSVHATITSLVDYEAAFQTSIFKPASDYKLAAKVRIEVPGRVRGEKPCGLLLVGNCEFDNADTKYFDHPIEMTLTKSGNFKARGQAQIDWKAVSGGSGMGSGLLFGGTMVFQATDEPRVKIIDVALTSLPGPLDPVGVQTSPAGAGNHPLDGVYQRAERSKLASQSKVHSGVYDDLVRVSGEAQGQALAVDEKVNQQRSSVSDSPPSGSRNTGGSEKPRSGWKIVKTYEGGFAEFGSDKSRTIYVVRCGSGAEHKLFRDDRNKWGTTGLGGNNAFSTMEEAASKKCN